VRSLYKGGQVIDPGSGFQGKADLLVENGKIVKRGTADDTWQAQEVKDVEGMLIFPGLVDLHTHLREPGGEHRETIQTGMEAAARGGYTTIFAMPNTTPPVDNPQIVEFIRSKARAKGGIRVEPIAAITHQRRGSALSPIGLLAEAGVKILSDDGSSVTDPRLMRLAMQYATMFNLVISDHCEDPNLAKDGVMNEGTVSTKLGLPPLPALAEETIVARDLLLAEETGARLHLAHLSTKRSLDLLRQAKDRGVRATAEVTVHHLLLTEEAVVGYNTNMKVNPPLRTEEDRQALISALADGTIDAIATDHAPWAFHEKEVEFDSAPFGMVGLETALSAIWTGLVVTGKISAERAIQVMSTAPSRIAGIDAGRLDQGAQADLIVFDPAASWVVDPSQFASKGKNTPFAGWKLQGRVVETVAGGNVVYRWEN
jgi:dihydroorotase